MIPLFAVGGLVFLIVVLSALFFSRPRSLLRPDIYQPVALIERETITHNTKRYRFALPRGVQLGLPVGQHISFSFTDSAGKQCMRSYTPVTGNETTGFVDFVIKIYPQGKMSQHIDSLHIHDTILMKGPKGTFKYQCNMKREIGMIAGGTGITPMYQVVKEILRNPLDTTKVSILFGNVSYQDILLKGELDALARQHPSRVHIYYVLDTAPENWTQGEGFITKEMIRDHCPPPAIDTMLLFCGPRPMVRAMEGHAVELGFSQANMHSF